MSSIDEVLEIEERLRQAELGPDPAFFERALADNAVLDASKRKSQIVEAHRPASGASQKFTSVEMSDVHVVDPGDAAVVTCTGKYSAERETFTLRFMRVWLKRNGRWQVIAGETLS